MAYKILSNEVAANTTASQFANNRVIRLAATGTVSRTITVFDDAKPLQLNINASANQTTLLTLANGSTTGLAANMRIFGSSNLAVINTVITSQVTSIVNSSALTSNVDIIIANGVCQIFATGAGKTFTILPNTALVIEKGRNDFLQSNNDTEILAVAINERG